MLSVLLGGRIVGSDPTQRVGASGKPFTVAKVSFAQDGDEPGFANVIAFGSAAEQLLRLKKGDDVAIAGRAGVQGWADKVSGAPKAGLRVVAESLLSAYEIAGRRKPKLQSEASE